MEKSNRLQEIRWSQGYSIRQFAEISGLSRPTISRIENGIVDPTRSQMIRIAQALNMPVSEIFDLKNP